MSDFLPIIGAAPADRRDLFVTTAGRLGTAVQNVEKDFWVSWTLDALFNRRDAAPRLLFKGGTSLSKAFGLVDRFSEDVDVTIFRDDLGEPADGETLAAMSGKARTRRLDAIKAAAQAYIAGDLLAQVAATLAEDLAAAGLAADAGRVELDPEDPDRQSLLVWFPAAAPAGDGYVRPAVKIEGGAKSALDPHRPATIRPYVADDVDGLSLDVPNVTTVDAERTFWDKVMILHGQRQWFDAREALRGGGERVSRHYYDLHRLLASPIAEQALADPELARDCARHAALFFGSRDLHLETATFGRFTLVPRPEMLRKLRGDYRAMSGMIFGDIPDFEEVIGSIAALEARLNSRVDE